MSVLNRVIDAEGENAFAIMGIVSKELRRRGVDSAQFHADATAGDYDDLNYVCQDYAERIDAGEFDANDPETGV